MAYDAEGELLIPAADFWQFVMQYVPDNSAEYLFGPPRLEKGAEDLCITYAASTTENHPSTWAEAPKAKKEWDK